MAVQVKVVERPILFSSPMVRAILEGRKTQTRRVIKNAPKGSFWKHPTTAFDEWYFTADLNPPSNHFIGKCPYGKVGDRLYVKETFWKHPDKVRYCVNDGAITADWNGEALGFRKVPSIFMPRKLSRITLEITEIRVQRLWEITREDAMAEGITQHMHEGGLNGFSIPSHEWDNRTSVENFAWLWDKLNAKRGYSWASNCWVWAISFSKL